MFFDTINFHFYITTILFYLSLYLFYHRQNYFLLSPLTSPLKKSTTLNKLENPIYRLVISPTPDRRLIPPTLSHSPLLSQHQLFSGARQKRESGTRQGQKAGAIEHSTRLSLSLSLSMAKCVCVSGLCRFLAAPCHAGVLADEDRRPFSRDAYPRTPQPRPGE